MYRHKSNTKYKSKYYIPRLYWRIEVMKLPKCLIGPKMIRNEFGEFYAYMWLTDFKILSFLKLIKGMIVGI